MQLHRLAILFMAIGTQALLSGCATDGAAADDVAAAALSQDSASPDDLARAALRQLAQQAPDLQRSTSSNAAGAAAGGLMANYWAKNQDRFELPKKKENGEFYAFAKVSRFYALTPAKPEDKPVYVARMWRTMEYKLLQYAPSGAYSEALYSQPVGELVVAIVSDDGRVLVDCYEPLRKASGTLASNPWRAETYRSSDEDEAKPYNDGSDDPRIPALTSAPTKCFVAGKPLSTR
jgi:hypothetical protein